MQEEKNDKIPERAWKGDFMKSMIHIGADVEQTRKVLPDLTDSILKILATSAGDDVKEKALEILSGSFEVKNVSISNSNFTGDPSFKKE